MVANKRISQDERDLQKLKLTMDITRKSAAPSVAPPTAVEPPVAPPVEPPVVEEVVEEVVQTSAPEPEIAEPVINITEAPEEIFAPGPENVTISDVVDKVVAEIDEKLDEILGTTESVTATSTSTSIPILTADVTLTAPPSMAPPSEEDIIEAIGDAILPSPAEIPNAAFSKYGADPMSTMLLCFVCLVVLTLR